MSILSTAKSVNCNMKDIPSTYTNVIDNIVTVCVDDGLFRLKTFY